MDRGARAGHERLRRGRGRRRGGGRRGGGRLLHGVAYLAVTRGGMRRKGSRSTGKGGGALDFDFKKRDLVVAGVEFLGEIQGAVRSGRVRPLDGCAVVMGRCRWCWHRRGHGFCWVF